MGANIQRELKLQVSIILIQLQAHVIAKKMKIEGFVASSQWADYFMKRKNICVCRPTTKQQLCKDLEFQVAKFRNTITDLKKDLPDNHIGNFDEVSVQWDDFRVNS